MEQVFQIVENHGLGFASFISLLYFIFRYEEKQTKCMEEISETLTETKITLKTLTDRVDKIEDIVSKKGGD